MIGSHSQGGFLAAKSSPIEASVFPPSSPVTEVCPARVLMFSKSDKTVMYMGLWDQDGENHHYLSFFYFRNRVGTNK